MHSRHLRRVVTTAASLLLVLVGLTAVAATSEVATASPAGGVFVPVTPFRLADATTGGTSAPMGPGEVRNYSVLGRDGIPSAGVSAVVVDIAAVKLLDAPESG